MSCLTSVTDPVPRASSCRLLRRPVARAICSAAYPPRASGSRSHRSSDHAVSLPRPPPRSGTSPCRCPQRPWARSSRPDYGPTARCNAAVLLAARLPPRPQPAHRLQGPPCERPDCQPRRLLLAVIDKRCDPERREKRCEMLQQQRRASATARRMHRNHSGKVGEARRRGQRSSQARPSAPANSIMRGAERCEDRSIITGRTAYLPASARWAVGMSLKGRPRRFHAITQD